MIETDIVVGTGMKLTCERDELAAKLSVVARAVSPRSSVQILSGVLFRVADDGVELAATDMELSLRSSLEGETEGDGAVVVPGRVLLDIVRLLPPGEVVLEHRADEGVVRMTAGTGEWRLNTYNAEDFPRLPEVDVDLHAIDRASLLDTVERVARAASRDESRPVLTGILVRFEDSKLVMAATDAYRLSVKETQLDEAAPPLEAIIPARALAELGRVAAGTDRVELGVRENHVVFGAGGVWLTTRRIDGQFPNYRQLVPESFEHELVVNRAELLDVARRVAVLAQRNSPLRLRFAEGELTVSAQTQDIGESRESLPVPFGGEPLEIGFNADFLREGLESVQAEEVKLKLISPLRPGLITAEEDDFWYLIMPIRLAG